jgi:acyl carrier protein
LEPQQAPDDASSELAVWLADRLRKIFGCESVEIDRNLFELGADSMIFAQLAVALYEQRGVEIAWTVMFESPTVREIAARIECTRQ